MSRKSVINCFLVCWLLALVIDAAPDMGSWHRQLRTHLDAYLDVTGLWQGNWQLFAPEPDKINVAISANVTFPDGQEVAWESPKWRTLSTWDRFLRFREAEFWDNVRKDESSCVWPTLADYLGRQIKHPEQPDLAPSKIVLTRHWVLIPPPDEQNIRQFPDVPPMNQSYIFYAKDFQP